jgi:hypothetical protein
MNILREGIFSMLKEDAPMTCRQVYYRLVSAGLIEKTENEYNNTTCRLLANMRRSGEIPYGWIADNTRWVRKPASYSNLEEMLTVTAKCYRKSLWMDTGVNVEIWLEKDALSGVLCDVTEEWDVPLMVTRGYPSLSFLHEAGQGLERSGKPAYIYYFGDYDPSGVDIPRVTERELRKFAPNTEINFEILAVTGEQQIKELNLITRPTKKSDLRSKKFIGESVEVDAIPSKTLRKMADQVISNHISNDEIFRIRDIEELERETLMQLAPYISGNG